MGKQPMEVDVLLDLAIQIARWTQRTPRESFTAISSRQTFLLLREIRPKCWISVSPNKRQRAARKMVCFGLCLSESWPRPRAAQTFQRLLEFRNIYSTDPLVYLAQLDMARAYALQRDNAHSRVAYQDFFAKWKDADPDLPLLRQAKAEYTKVQEKS
jgi:hypothetical protein